MKVAVLSGKGGTGKTFVSVNLAAISHAAVYIDCDVEEPNGRLFFKPQDISALSVSVKIPVVDYDKCNGCRRCVEFCRFNALAYVNRKVIIFDDICHSCGGCEILCPEKAISETDKEVGIIETGISQNVKVLTGVLNTGEESGVPIIRKLIDELSSDDDFTVIDCPPGSACVVMESIKDADYCILVAEPTLFGNHNIEMVYELVRLFNKPFGVVINKCLPGENLSEQFCTVRNIPILAKIPFSTELGTINSKGLVAVREKKKYREMFSELLDKVVREVQP